MKRRILSLLTAATLATAGVAVFQSHWLAPRADGATQPADVRDSDAFRRYANNQATHWRDIALKH
jgi:hypothetical protein